MKNYIGIPQEKAEGLVKSLNTLLATYSVYYQNLRGFHWNITGKEFFELHIKFEELYTAAQLTIDEVAERILTLGGKPLHTFEQFLKESQITSAEGLTSAKDTVRTTLDNLNSLIRLERIVATQASDAGDDGTLDLLTPTMREQEKTTWMLRSYLD
jgi:starvation-inducible DNA-binding protein